jgi:O-antigen/teichoic acid export membrane protein
MDRTGFTKLLRQSLVGLGGLSTLISVALALLAPLVIRFLDPDPAYTPAVAALQILVWSYPFFCVNSVLYAALVSVNDETFISIFLLGAVVVNVGLNLFMIPAFGINGAAYATIAPEIVLTFVYIGRMRFRMARGAMQPQEGVSERP